MVTECPPGYPYPAALAMGAAGVLLGSRMLVAEEMRISAKYKQMETEADGTESVIVKKAIRNYHRVYNNESARAVMALDNRKETDFELYRPHVSSALAREAYRTGDPSKGMLDFGPSVVFADRIEPVVTIFDRLLDDAAGR